MRRARYRARMPWLLLALLLLAVAPANAQPTAMGTEVVAVYPHDARAFTQGLLLHDGALFESTGLVGRSSVRQVELTTGKVMRQKDLPAPLFGEGLAWANDELVQLTWQNHRALRWAPATFESRGEWSYDGEGWGLASTARRSCRATAAIACSSAIRRPSRCNAPLPSPRTANR